MSDKVGRCHDCTAPQTEVNMLSRHILELQKDKGELTDRVRELEAEVKEWKDKADLWCKTANLKDHNIMINKELEKENAELKCECRRCVYSDCPCILSDYGKDRNGICDHFKDVFDEIVELKHTIAELRRDKDNLNTHTKAQEKLSEYRSDQLTKAKELIENIIRVTWGEGWNYSLDWKVKAEQFIKGGTMTIYEDIWCQEAYDRGFKEGREFEKGKLTKAKELLTRFLMASVYFNGKEADLIKEVEQFLKE